MFKYSPALNLLFSTLFISLILWLNCTMLLGLNLKDSFGDLRGYQILLICETEMWGSFARLAFSGYDELNYVRFSKNSDSYL